MYTAVAVCLYNYPKPTVQLYRQGKGVSSDDDRGGCLLFYTVTIYHPWFPSSPFPSAPQLDLLVTMKKW